ncbi:Uncharacterized protein dnm_026970 [Desulfonema magnum]|uniref:Uncharacterized protein n=1 Tax=Desulfonema magnum TaxID=45655 RepID=A0A975BKA2_9BACT|nr:Uncharacterized protein dnm_026970 [Desulfonema magnum]
MNEIQCPDNRGTERDSSLPLQDYQNLILMISEGYRILASIMSKELFTVQFFNCKK